MKILSRMLSKKIDPQNADELDYDVERQQLDDAGQVRPTRVRGANVSQPIVANDEEPEVAGSGWATDGDWDDDWDDDDDWGAEDDPSMDLEERRKTEDKKHLVGEIREAMISVSHVQPDEEPVPDAKEAPADLAEDEVFGRQARARSQLQENTGETEERLMEKTEDVMSDRETSRRRSALAHMKAAAAATKADRVLRHVAGHDAAADPEEQSPYRDDLAKVVRPHSGSRPISRQVSRPDAPTPVWDQGAGDEDAALFAASESGMHEDPAHSVDSELTAAEELRLARAPTELSAEDFSQEDLPRSRAARDFPSSRFAVPLEDGDADQSAFDNFEDAAEDIAASVEAEEEDFDPFADEEFDDGDFDDLEDGPTPSSVVAEAVAFANAPDEDVVEEEPEVEVRKKIWEMADEVAAEVESTRNAIPSAPLPDPEPPHEMAQRMAAPEASEDMLDVQAGVIPGRSGRSAGRVKTRLLGFQTDDEAKDVFAAKSGQAPMVADMFPTGWIVVIDGPGRGASFSLHSGVSQIGRGEDQTVRLDFGDTSISRNNHAAVAFDEEQSKFFLGHGGKSNLVRLNGSPVLSTEELTDGDEIRIGETSLKFVALCGDEFSWNGDGDNGEDA